MPVLKYKTSDGIVKTLGLPAYSQGPAGPAGPAGGRRNARCALPAGSVPWQKPRGHPRGGGARTLPRAVG